MVDAAGDGAERTVANPDPVPAHADLVGREADMRRLGAFSAGIARDGGSLLVLGEPGVGKSSLLAALARQAEADGMRVLRTVGVQYRAQPSYGALRQLLTSSPETGSAAQDVPVLAGALGFERGAVPGHEAVTAALLALAAEISRDTPTLLVVDDVQWLDRASAVVLGQVARRLFGSAAAMVCAARPGDESFLDYSGLPLHELGPLSEAASEVLLTRRFPALAARVRRRLMADAQGNPLALLELPAALTDSQRTAAVALPALIPLTQRLQSTFASRINGLPAATRHLLLVAALEGSGNLQIVRRAVAGRCSLKQLAPAERARLVSVDDATGRLGFRHPLIRAAVVELSTSDQRRNVHRALAEAWIAVPEQRVWHLAQAAVEPDEQIAALLEETADLSARRGDGPNAVAALVRAADLSPVGSEQARRLAKAAYLGANLTGDLRDVPRLLEDARKAAPDADSESDSESESLSVAMAAAAYLLNGYGDVDTAHRLLSGAIAQQPEPYDAADATLLEALASLLMVCVYGGRREQWSDFDAAVARLTDVPDTLRLMRATFGDPARAGEEDWARLDAAIATLPGSSDPGRIVRIGTAGAYADRLGAVQEPLRRTARGGRNRENVFPAIQALSLLGSHAWFSGQWSELRQLVDEALALCEEFQYPLRSWTATFVLGCACAACGDFDEARALADRMDQWAGSRRAGAVRRYAAHVRMLISLTAGEFEEAYLHGAAVAPAGSLPPFAGQALWMFMDTVEAAVRTGRGELALAHVRAARDAGLGTVSPRLAMVVLASAGLAAHDDAEALLRFGEALAVEGAERWPFELARIRLYCGERLRRGRSPVEARRHLGAAAEIFARLGAVPWAERANKELRACGSPVAAPARAVGAVLTPQQWEIASLAAAGLSNKQIGERLQLSPRTVSTHLYQLFPKLGVSSRGALRDALEHLAPR